MNNTEIQKAIDSVDENNIALRNSLVAFDNVCNSLQSEKLKLSVAIELLTSRIDTEVEIFRRDKDQLSVEDLEEIARCCRFITENSRHDYSGTAIEIEEYLENI